MCYVWPMTASVAYQLGRSLRSYRRFIEQMVREQYQGRRPAEDVAKITTAIKTAAELFLAERQLVGAGGDAEAASPDLPAGEAPDLGPVGTFRRKRVQVRTGVDKHGNTVDDKTVTIDTAAGDDDGELDAEVQALM